jgi:hypothetical protein
MGDPTVTPFTAVFLAAGLSSRFGFRIKCLQELGRHGETLLELSVRQLKEHAVADIVIVVSDGTYQLIHAVCGDRFLGLDVKYAFQVTPEYRKKPLGTVHALLAAKPLVTRPFIVLNGDTLYGDALRQVCLHVSTFDNPSMPGFPLKDVLPKSGTCNRAVINVEGSSLTSIVEQYNISVDDIASGAFSGNELTSMNIFAFQASIFDFLQRKYDAWLAENAAEEVAEYILSTMMNDLLPEQGVKTTVYGVDNTIPLELTNPDDFAYVKNNLDKVGL